MSRQRTTSAIARGRWRRGWIAAVLATAGLVVATTGLATGALARAGKPGHTRTRGPAAWSSHHRPHTARADCVYSADSVAVLGSFQRMVGHRFSCVLVFNNAAPTWATWEQPWFIDHPSPAYDWGSWATARGTHRQLIISQNLFPSSLNGTDWLRAGAAGRFAAHARALARNLVAAGLGHSVIRLAHEANDTASPYSIGSTPRQWGLWRRFWRLTVLAMRSVPGAHFLFDWCVNAYWRPIPLSDWYPGDDVVDFIGIDAYDSGVPPGADRWQRIYTQPDGIRDVLQFASDHDKPVSLPEWGLMTPGPPNLGGGDDPAYVNGMAQVVRENPVAYQAYFYNLTSSWLLRTSPRSLAAYRRHFGPGGDSVGSGTISH